MNLIAMLRYSLVILTFSILCGAISSPIVTPRAEFGETQPSNASKYISALYKLWQFINEPRSPRILTQRKDKAKGEWRSNPQGAGAAAGLQFPSYADPKYHNVGIIGPASVSSNNGGWKTKGKAHIERVARPPTSPIGSQTQISKFPYKHGRPSTISSGPLHVIDGPKEGERGGRSLKEVEIQGVRIIVADKMPDFPSSLQK